MEPTVPKAEDHCRIQILVRPLGHRSATVFNRLLERLSRVEAIEVSENPRRVILAKFVTNVNPELVKFGELQAHRRVFGFIGVGQASRPSPPPADLNDPKPSTSSGSFLTVDADHGSDTSSVRSFESIGGDSSTPRRPTKEPKAQLAAVKEQFETFKAEYSGHLVDSRCALFGFSKDDIEEQFEPRELLSFTSLEESEEFENGIRELIRSIYFVLESRRLDQSYEKMETPPCPILPEEEKYRMGLENKQSKAYKKKCVGRLRKQVADYTLLTGLPALALDAYQSAIDCLKATTDLLWLGAAYEGWSCAAMAVRYSDSLEQTRRQTGMSRVSTMTPEQMREYQTKLTQHTLGVSLGHQRHRSDDDRRALAAAAATASAAAASPDVSDSESPNTSLNTSGSGKKLLKRPWTLLTDRSKSVLDHTEIVDRFKLSLEQYERFGFAAFIEYECVVRAASVYTHQRLFIEAEAFLREHVGKFLDDKYVAFNNYTKAQVCMTCASIYKDIGFLRKNGFFARLAVLFRLHSDNPDEVRTESDYRVVYPILYKTLPGYGIHDSVRNAPLNGPVAIQFKALHEVFMSALRAGQYDAAIRHLCYILQIYYDTLDMPTSLRLIDELARLVAGRPQMHNLSQHISLDQCGIILPPLQMTRFPVLSDVKVTPLPAYLSPTVIQPSAASQIFIYSPFQDRDQRKANKHVYWVVDCACEVSVRVQHFLPMELVVNNLTLITEGCAFEAVPVRLNLPPNPSVIGGEDAVMQRDTFGTAVAAAEIRLLGVPRSPGRLTITGYSCEVLGVKNVCALRTTSDASASGSGRNGSGNSAHTLNTVEVLQALPVLQVETSLKRAPTVEENVEPTAETTVFSGQTFEHSVYLFNKSHSIGIKRVTVDVQQPKVFGGPQLVQIISPADVPQTPSAFRTSMGTCVIPEVFDLKPRERREIRIRIFGIDPSATANEEKSALGDEQKVYVRRATTMSSGMEGGLSRLSLSSVPSIVTSDSGFADQDPAEKHPLIPNGLPNYHGGDAAGHDLIPYSGRLLSAECVFTYTADLTGAEGEHYQRTARMPLAVTIVPAITVTDWHVLSGDGPTTRYVVVDVSNLTDADAELTYGEGKAMTVQPKEVCRVPLLCPCCSEIEPTAFINAKKRASHMMQMQEIEKLRRTLEKHVSRYLDIRWSIPALQLDGHVPVGSLLSSVAFLKQLVVPAVSVNVFVNGKPYVSQDDVSVGIGELVSIQVCLLSSIRDRSFTGHLSLRCYQDLQNGDALLDRSEHIVPCGVTRVPFAIDAQPTPDDDRAVFTGRFETTFRVMFRFEGIHKIRPLLETNAAAELLSEDEIFVPQMSFNVTSKVFIS